MGIVREQSIKNSISFYIGLVFGALSTIILYPNAFNSHPEHLGLLQIIVAYSTVIATFSYLGTPKTIIRFFPKVEHKNQLISLAFLIPIIGFLLFLFLYFLFKDQFLTFINADSLLRTNFNLVFFLVAFLSFFEVLSALSRSLLNAIIPIFLKEVFLKGINILLLILHWNNIIDFPTFLNLYISIYLCMILILCYTIFSNFSYSFTFNFTDIQSRNLLVFGMYVLVGGASAMLISKVDMMMIANLMDLQHVAFYTVAFFIGNVIRVPGKAVVSIAAPLIAKASEKNNISEIKDIYVKSSINQLLFGGLIFLGIWLNIEDGLSLLPPKFQGGEYVVLFIGLSQLFNMATGINGIIIINSKYFKFDLYSNIILFFITLYTNWIFIPESSPLSTFGIVGINGAAFATALSVFIFNSIKMVFVYLKLGIQPFNIKTIQAILLIIGVYFIVDYFVFYSNVMVDICIRFVLLFLLYFPLMIIFRISEDINKMSLKMWTKFLGKN